MNETMKRSGMANGAWNWLVNWPDVPRNEAKRSDEAYDLSHAPIEIEKWCTARGEWQLSSIALNAGHANALLDARRRSPLERYRVKPNGVLKHD